MLISELEPGDMLENNLSHEMYVFIGVFHPHPIFGEEMSLVIWYKWIGRGKYVMDALSPSVDIPFQPVRMTDDRRRFFLQQALQTYVQQGGG